MDTLSRLPRESTAWYIRFLTFLSLGPGRTVVAVWRSEAVEGRRRRVLPGNWRRAARLYRWTARAAAYDLDRAQDTLAKLESRELAMRLRDIDEINLLYGELEKLKTHLRSRPPTLTSFLGMARATNALHRLTDKALTRMAKYRDTQKESERQKPILLTMPNLPSCITQPRNARQPNDPVRPAGDVEG